MREKKLQDDLNYAMSEITRIKQTAQKDKAQYMKRIADIQKENDTLKARLGEPGAPKMTTEHILNELFFIATGECFHHQSCPTVVSPYNRPMKLAKCKRCF